MLSSLIAIKKRRLLQNTINSEPCQTKWRFKHPHLTITRRFYIAFYLLAHGRGTHFLVAWMEDAFMEAKCVDCCRPSAI